VPYLRESLQRGAGIIVAPNHWSLADGPLLAALGRRADTFFYYLVSDHILRQPSLRSWLLNRLGCYSILREAVDREALRASVKILVDADRPLVIFAEGTWYRQNDRLGPFQPGVGLIAQKAARQTERPIVIHPVAIKYWLLNNPQLVLDRRLAALEKHFGCRPGQSGELVPRIERVTAAWLTTVARSYSVRSPAGELDIRREALLAKLLGLLESDELGRVSNGPVMERVRRLRQVNVARLADDANATKAEAQLDALLTCELLFSHSLAYLREKPSWERVAETVQRLAEIVWDQFAPPVAPMGVVIEVGKPIDVRAFRDDSPRPADQRDALTAQLAADIQALLDRLVIEGPPPSWNITGLDLRDDRAPITS
jgi:hypothetical protein